MASDFEFTIGLMSGTALDGVDGVLTRCEGRHMEVLGHVSLSMPPTLRHALLDLQSPGPNELHRSAQAAHELMVLYNDAVQRLLSVCNVRASTIAAIGAHGQTLRHRPQPDRAAGEHAYTVQLCNPALLAELSGIRVVADFRSRDIAAGGQGAPLVPAFHQTVFAQPDRTVMVLNLGGISNLSVLAPASETASTPVLGFDCGPANALMDHWCELHTGQLYDAAGRWAAGGQVIEALLDRMLQEPFLRLPPPKSTGRDLFNPDWLGGHLAGFAFHPPQDVQATLAMYTARTCADGARAYADGPSTLIVCGGGALNRHLMGLLQQQLPGWNVCDSGAHGLPPLQVEAAAFSWLARQALLGLPGNLPAVTGARGLRVLGAIYPA